MLSINRRVPFEGVFQLMRGHMINMVVSVDAKVLV